MPWRPLEEDSDEPVRIDQSLNKLTQQLGGTRVDVLRTIFDEWDEIVGEPLASYTTPSSLADGVLVLHTPDPAWAKQITFLTEDLKGKVNAVAGPDAVREIDVRVRRP